MANGGSVIPKGRGKWEVQVSLGRDPETGKYHRVSRTVRGSKTDARKMRDTLLKEVRRAGEPTPPETTFLEFTGVWAGTWRATSAVRDSTFKGTMSALGHFNRHLGGEALSRITPQMIEDCYEDILSKGELGDTSVHHMHRMVKRIFAKACDYGLVDHNPCVGIPTPKMGDPNRRSLSSNQVKELRQQLDESEAQALSRLDGAGHAAKSSGERRRAHRDAMGRMGLVALVRLALATGMRLGELMALTWDAIDLEQGLVSVVRAISENGELSTPKSHSSMRTIHVDGDTIRRLAEWKGRQADELARASATQSGSTPVCSTERGGFMSKSSFDKMWRLWRVEAGFPDLKFHELRHTHATQLLAAGTNVRTVQHRLGHATEVVTLDHYVHAVPENDRIASEIMGRLIEGNPAIATGLGATTAAAAVAGSMTIEGRRA